MDCDALFGLQISFRNLKRFKELLSDSVFVLYISVKDMCVDNLSFKNYGFKTSEIGQWSEPIISAWIFADSIFGTSDLLTKK